MTTMACIELNRLLELQAQDSDAPITIDAVRQEPALLWHFEDGSALVVGELSGHAMCVPANRVTEL